jgi:hypothetical protein
MECASPGDGQNNAASQPKFKSRTCVQHSTAITCRSSLGLYDPIVFQSEAGGTGVRSRIVLSASRGSKPLPDTFSGVSALRESRRCAIHLSGEHLKLAELGTRYQDSINGRVFMARDIQDVTHRFFCLCVDHFMRRRHPLEGGRSNMVATLFSRIIAGMPITNTFVVVYMFLLTSLARARAKCHSNKFRTSLTTNHRAIFSP